MNILKKIVTASIFFFLIPQVSFGYFTTPLAATSTSQGWVFPLPINGTFQSMVARNFIASTTLLNVFPNASTTNLSANVLCLTGDVCRTTWPSAGSFAWPFSKQGDGFQATSTGMLFSGGFVSSASTTIGASGATTGLTIFGGATTTGNFLVLGSTTLQSLFSPSATATSLYTSNFLSFGSSTIGHNTADTGLTIFGGATTTGASLHLGSTTLQSFTATEGTITSATSTNLTTKNLLVNGSTTLQNFFAQSGTTTNSYPTNLLVAGSTTLQAMTSSSSTIGTLLANNGTSTNFFVSNNASTTNLFSNVGTIGKLTVTACTGCAGTGNSFTQYTASTTGNASRFKQLALSSGDMVEWCVYGTAGATNHGTIQYKINSPGPMASTTVFDMTSLTDSNVTQGVCAHFEATTTETVTFSYQTGGGAVNTDVVWRWFQSYGFTNWVGP